MSREEQFDFYWKEIFDGLPYNPIEFNVYRFDQSMSLPGKLNKLYDMFKVLALNNQEVMDYLKEFVETFDFKLETTVKDVLVVWLNEGLLADIVREAISEEVIEARTDYLDHTYLNLKERLDLEREEVILARGESQTLGTRLDDVTTQLAENTQQIDSLGININKYKHLVVNDDWTNAIQTALNENTNIYFPKGDYEHGKLFINNFGTTLSGEGQNYGGSRLIYKGFETGLTVNPSVNYITIRNLQVSGVPIISTDYYNTGSVGIDISGGAVLNLDSVWVQGFESLIKSNFDSYYNKIINSRLEKAKICLDGFSINNFEIKGNRFLRFHTAIRCNGTNGPMVINKNSFEYFNSFIVNAIGTEKGLVIFKDNYVEIYDTHNLPTNFPDNTIGGAKVGKFGGNTLFGGSYESLTIEDNEMQIGGVFRVLSAITVNHLKSTGNLYHIYAVGNNLGLLYIATNIRTFYINDSRGVDVGANGGYTRTYNQVKLPTSDPYADNYFFDPISNKHLVSESTLYRPVLSNGWVNTATIGYGDFRLIVKKEGLYLQGTVDGTVSTDIVITTLPESVRPFIHGTSKSFCNLIAYTNFGAGEKVYLRYLYGSGVLRIEGSPTSKANITLDGLIIPMQI